MKPTIFVFKHGITNFLAMLAIFSAQAEEIDATGMINAHNRWRAEVGITESLKYSQTLAESAQDWADHLKRTNHCLMRHSKGDTYGENLYWASALSWSDGRKELQQVTARQVVDKWGEEKVDYDYASNSCMQGMMCGHYTQVVWRTTTMVGCAMAVCEDSKEVDSSIVQYAL